MSKSIDYTQPLIAVRLRGGVRAYPELKMTLESLRLKKKFNAVLIYDTPSVKGALRKAKDYITWGIADQDIIVQLLKGRGRIKDNQRINNEYISKEFPEYNTVNELASAIVSGDVALSKLWKGGIKPVFRLHPPKRGFKKSTKRPLKSEGELGDRGLEIKYLIKNMI